jgi:hypothetical protein
MTSGIIEILIENAGVIAAVGRDDNNQVKVYPMIAPQGVEAPYVTVSEVSLNPALAKQCSDFMDSPRYNVMVYSLDFRETELIQAACRAALDTGAGFTTDAGAEFDSIYMMDRQDLWMPSTGESSGLYVKVGVYAAEVRS